MTAAGETELTPEIEGFRPAARRLDSPVRGGTRCGKTEWADAPLYPEVIIDTVVAQAGVIHRDEERVYRVTWWERGAAPVEVAAGRSACGAISPDGDLIVVAVDGVFRGLRRDAAGAWKEAWAFEADQPIQVRSDAEGAVVAAAYGRSLLHMVVTGDMWCFAAFRTATGERIARFDVESPELAAVWPASDHTARETEE